MKVNKDQCAIKYKLYVFCFQLLDSIPYFKIIYYITLSTFSTGSGLSLSLHKSCFNYNCSDVSLTGQIHRLFSLKMSHINNGLKYRGYFLKTNKYKKPDWKWLLVKIQRKLDSWTSRWMSLGGILMLITLVL